ncbi:MAG: site-specific integrase [Kiritimatiellae bacterium]|nr:site-specific integrase [Kiritimatiellia bacterium]MDD5520743.1 site-specific integrase [Kiritimatiellia bacterium]
MPLELRKNRDGTIRPTFYGRYLDKAGKLKCINLGIPIRGTPPKTLHGTGDKSFEDSRKDAMAKLSEYIQEGHTVRHQRYWAEKVYELKSGGELTSTPLDKFPAEAWTAIGHRKHRVSDTYRNNIQHVLTRFVQFMQSTFPKVKETAAVRSNHVREFMAEEDKRSVSVRTWNWTLGVLKSAFRYLEPNADAYTAFLMNAKGRTGETIHREPFKPDEIKAVLEAAQGDELMRPLITTALCTAMRRGDCALLKWSNVNLTDGFITIKTSKTGESVEIPIMPPLRDELVKLQKNKGDYVFPEAAAMYRENPDGLNWRLREILAKAGFVDVDTAERVEYEKKHPRKKTLPVIPINEVRTRGLAWIDKAKMTDGKRARLRTVFTEYLAGKSMSVLAKDLTISKGSISGHIREVQNAIGVAVVREQKIRPLPTVIRGLTQAENGAFQRVKKANLKGWHSFRTTFITLALSAGIPMELVRRVTGHTTFDVVLKHYFRPDREQYKQAMQAGMPKLLASWAKKK